ncbi:hypothetical protein ATANTOWER_015450 [Ataeniobius toweri]|uniref:Uncharacterized protein n=1 Tax=Ataeniobius toweri TaxID=208326 RepID=A0ABU7AAB3_9TELE|nr:hypothetical protein [Ataeniobius toweri]
MAPINPPSLESSPAPSHQVLHSLSPCWFPLCPPNFFSSASFVLHVHHHQHDAAFVLCAFGSNLSGPVLHTVLDPVPSLSFFLSLLFTVRLFPPIYLVLCDHF